MAIGAVLRQARERRGLTIEEVASASRIPVHYVEALEADQFDDIPAPVYVRGFLRVYGRLLDIDTAPLLDELVATWPPAGAAPEPPAATILPPVSEPAAWEIPDAHAPLPALPHRRVISEVEDDWEAELEPVVRTRGNLGHGRKKSGHSGGVLSEREPSEPVRLPDRRLMILAGAGVILLTAVLLGTAIFRGTGGSGNAAGPSPSANRTIQPGTVITVQTPTSASASPVTTGMPGTPAATTAASAVSATPLATATP